MENDNYINIDLSSIGGSEDHFKKLTQGRHSARIISCIKEHKEYMKNAASLGSGACITWCYETFGNDDTSQNNKKIFQSTPLDGKFAKITRNVIYAAVPDIKENKFKPEDMLGKEVEIDLVYNRDKTTGEERKYPNVKGVYPLVGVTSDIPNFEDYSSSVIPF